MKKTLITTLAILSVLVTTAEVEAGTLYPTSAPGESMYSLQELYDLLTSGISSEEGNGAAFATPSTVNGSMVTLSDLYAAIAEITTPAATGEFSLVQDGTENEDVEVQADATTPNVNLFTGKATSVGGHSVIHKVSVRIISSETALHDVIQNVKLKINGNTVSVQAPSVNSSTIDFAYLSSQVEADEDTIMTIEAEFKPQAGNYEETGEKVRVSEVNVTATGIEGIFGVVPTGKTIRLFLEESESEEPGPVIEGDPLTADLVQTITVHQGVMGRFVLRFDLAAGSEDVYIPKDFNPSYVAINNAPATADVDTNLIFLSTIEEVDNHYKIPAGTLKSFTLGTEVTNKTAATMPVRVSIDGIDYRLETTTSSIQKLNVSSTEYRTESLTLHAATI